MGVLHRDLKPANVMLRPDDSVSLIDFGLAKANENDVSLTGTREIFGTPYYMSPEQGHAEIIDARSDLYSLGVVFYEMLIGRKPYNGATAMEVIYKHKRAELPEIAPQFASLRRAAAPTAREGSRRSLSIRRRAAGSHLRPENSGMSGCGGVLPTRCCARRRRMAWIAEACARPEVLLIDHANCEKKAASTALALMFAYAEDLELTDKMSRLAREELRHYEQVAKLIGALKIAPQRLAPGRYATQLRRLVASGEPQREVDLMICGAFIEARSCERFAALAAAIGCAAGGFVPRPARSGSAALSAVFGPCRTRGGARGLEYRGANRAICRARGAADHGAGSAVQISFRSAAAASRRCPSAARQRLQLGAVLIPAQHAALIVPIP